MDTVKARKQGNSIMVTLSSKLGVEAGQEYYYYKDSKGIISLIPKVEDFFLDAEEGEYVDKEDEFATNYSPKGQELND
ncbi:type II toxin-antitoxin system PemI/MazE family antitoxin [Alkalibacterium sp. MB6]|uniref:type II toxin-antitoxin system PemI/MazE family antitoxin n=1 Tax=Alkalibacterium sp. MB6 TaxID=2081965 RepID=UPI00137AEE1C|nr:AbrB family transcriptional regulator [Alkalibacterium sp. MB6]